MIKQETDRRTFLKQVGIAGAGLSLMKSKVLYSQSSPMQQPYLVVVKNGSPAQMVEKAVQMLGGMSRFVKKNQIVTIKPNISWDRNVEQGANTHPEIAATLVKLALQAGAKQVRVFDRSCNEARRCYANSGIEEAVRNAGAKVYYVQERNYVDKKIPQGKSIQNWDIYKDLLESDVVINVPVLKNHGMTQVSIGLKNLMGFLGGDRGKIHRDFDQKMVDIATIIKSDLTVIDATRVIMRNGPQGGNLDDVKIMNTLVASTEMFSADAFAASLMGFDSGRLGYMVEAQNRGLGIIDLKKMKIDQVNLS